ncbi:hypothetical protein ACMH5Q_11280 [Aquirufa lenticrescens]
MRYLISLLLDLLWVNSDQRLIYSKSKFTLSKRNNLPQKKILVPFIEDIGTMLVVKKLLNRLAESYDLQITYFYVHCSFEDTNLLKINNGIFYKICSLIKYNELKLIKISLLYNVSFSKLRYSNFLSFDSINGGLNFLNKWDVLEYKYANIVCGDLIYDTYLRFFSSATIKIDSKLYSLVDYSNKLIKYWDNVFGKKSFDLLLLPYGSYLQWGIPSRVAIKNNINVYYFGNSNYLIQNATNYYPFHSKNYNLYRENWNLLKSKKVKLNQAKSRFDNRFKGEISDISYMKKSSYSNGLKFNKCRTNNKFAVIFLHCFFDSPHIYGSGLFPDFFEWLDFLLENASCNKNVDFYIKPHPNGLPGNDSIVQEFIKKYKRFTNLIFIDKNIDNYSIIVQKPKAVFSFYGTIAAEFAYFNIPVILSGDSPFSTYKFVIKPNSQEKLIEYIQNIDKLDLPVDFEFNKEEILQFYYMNYMYFTQKYDISNATKSINLNDGTLFIPDGKLEELIFS